MLVEIVANMVECAPFYTVCDAGPVNRSAQQQLGSRFDIRTFHDAVLGGGSLPLDVLDARISRWIATQAATSAKP